MNFVSIVRRVSWSFLLPAMLLSNCPSPVEAQSESLERQGGSGEGPGEQTNMGSKSIEGAWLVVVEIPVANLSFTAITTFAAGGVSSSTGAFDRLAQISPLYGTWKRTDRNRFDRTVYLSGGGQGRLDRRFLPEPKP